MPKTQWSIKRHDSDARWRPSSVKKCLYYFALSKEAIKSKQQLLDSQDKIGAHKRSQ